MKRLFKNLDLNNLSVDGVRNAFKEENEKSDVYLTFKWTPNRRILIYKLHLKTSTALVDLLKDKAINSKEGLHTVFVGSFENKADLEISYAAMGLVAIPKFIVIIAQNRPDVAYQASPKNPVLTNKIESGEKFPETLKHTVQ